MHNHKLWPFDAPAEIIKAGSTKNFASMPHVEVVRLATHP